MCYTDNEIIDLLISWLRIYVVLAIFQLVISRLESRTSTMSKIVVAGPGIKPRACFSARQELNLYMTAAHEMVDRLVLFPRQIQENTVADIRKSMKITCKSSQKLGGLITK